MLPAFALNGPSRYRFSVDTIVAAKEDSLLLPPELLHDPERRCDASRRHVTVRAVADVACPATDSLRKRRFIRWCRRYKRDGSDVLGLMHYDERIGYLLRQVRRAVVPSPSLLSVADYPPLLTRAHRSTPAASCISRTLCSGLCLERRDSGRDFIALRWSRARAKEQQQSGLNFIFHSRFRFYFCSRETQIPFDRVDMLYKCDNEDGHH